MQKNYDHKLYEEEIIKKWNESGAFKAKAGVAKKPYTIVLPPPNASGKMHTGNVLMIAIEDILIRWHRMKGETALWIPGTDHAGTETQITFERELKKQGKSRFNFNREDFYKEVWTFVIWVLYAGYIHARATRGWRGKRSAWLSIIGFFSVIFTYYGVNFLLSGLHSYGGGG